MGIFLLICFIVLEMALMISSFSKFSEKKHWLVARCVFRAGELAVFLFVMLLPNVTFDFKYQLCFALLIICLAGALVMYLIKRTTASGKRSKAGAVFGAVGSIVILALSLIPAFIFTEYAGLETSGEYEVAQAAAILIDKDRVETFETDGSNREIPVHFYYPKAKQIAQSSCPVVLFSHGAFGYYQSNTSTYMELASNGYVVISAADVVMLNTVGQSAISAVSLAVQYTNVLFMVYYGLGTGATMLCAQYWGKGDIKAIEKVEGIALRFSLAISLLFALPALFVPELMMKVFTNDVQLISLGADYLRIISVSYLCWSISSCDPLCIAE